MEAFWLLRLNISLVFIVDALSGILTSLWIDSYLFT